MHEPPPSNAPERERPDQMLSADTLSQVRDAVRGALSDAPSDKALSEAHRVLKRGGRFLCLEFSKVDVPGFDRIYREFSDRVIPNIGGLVTRDRESYQYLVESIRKFPEPAAFSAMIAAAGFKRVTHTAFSGNIAALHGAWKI